MNLQVNANLTVYLEAASRFYGEKKVFIQWKPMVKGLDDTWSLDTNSANSIVGLVAEGDAYDLFVNLSDDAKLQAYTDFLTTQYAN